MEGKTVVSGGSKAVIVGSGGGAQMVSGTDVAGEGSGSSQHLRTCSSFLGAAHQTTPGSQKEKNQPPHAGPFKAKSWPASRHKKTPFQNGRGHEFYSK